MVERKGSDSTVVGRGGFGASSFVTVEHDGEASEAGSASPRGVSRGSGSHGDSDGTAMLEQVARVEGPALSRTEEASPVAPAVVGARVDWLTLAFSGYALEALEYLRQCAVDEAGKARPPFPAEVGGRACVVQLIGPALWVRAPAMSARWLPDTSGFPLQIDFTGRQCIGRSYSELLATARRWARSMLAVTDTRCRRIDQAVDVVGLSVHSAATGRWVMRGRSKGKEFNVRFTDGNETTGYQIAPQGDLTLVVYNKTAEVSGGKDPARAEAERSIWKAGGWDGVSEITRVEARWRGDALKTANIVDGDGAKILGLRDNVDALGKHLSTLWLYVVTKWARLVDGPYDRARSSTPQEAWAVLATAAVSFSKSFGELVRKRPRSVASEAQVLGTMMSLVEGRTGTLPRLGSVVVSDVQEWVHALASRAASLIFGSLRASPTASEALHGKLACRRVFENATA